MGLLDNIGKKSKAKTPARAGVSGSSTALARPGGSKAPATRSKGKLARKKGGPNDKVAGAAAPLHDRRRRLVSAREATLRDLGGLMLEMYKRNRFREELLLDKCEEVLAIEVEIAHIDQRLFQLAPPNAAGMRPIGRCECGAPIHPGQNFCGLCGRSFTTLTQTRMCERCGAGLRAGDTFCASCGTQAPDLLDAIEAPSKPTPMAGAPLAAPPAPSATSNMADTMIVEVPPPVEAPVDTAAAAAAPTPPITAAAATATPPAPAPASFESITPPMLAVEPLSPAPTPPLGDAQVSDVAGTALGSLPSELQFPDIPPAAPAPVSLPAPVAPAVQAPAEPAAAPAAPAAPASSPADDRRRAKERAKQVEKLKKDKARLQKERAKQRMKDARAAKKRGDGGA